MQDLKLIALDAEDLAALSAHLQDAVVRVADMTFLKGEKRFAAVLNRFDWGGTVTPSAAGASDFVRRRAGLRFERVLGAQVSGIDQRSTDTVLSLLAVSFEPESAPEGFVTLSFSGGGAVRLHVECIEAELKDLGAAWTTKRRPVHDIISPDKD
jgi:hypothetical protein